MRVEIWKFDGCVNRQNYWTPREIPFGSNIRGLRIRRGSVSIRPEELKRMITSDHPDCLKRIQDWLIDLEHCYKD